MKEQKKSESDTKLTAAQKTLQQLWEEHVRHEFATHNTEDTLATMVEDAYVNHIPVLTGGVGKDELREFYSKRFIPQMPPDTEMVPISRTIGNDRLNLWLTQISFFSMNFSVTIVGALIGAVVLFFGRKLFWLCVAAIGFAAGVELAPHLVHEPSALLSLTIALLLGIIGALLALFLQKIAIAVLGFLAGGKLAGATAAAFFVHYAQHSTIIFVLGGIIGAILLLALFDWALIVLSSLIGAHLIQSAIVLPPSGSTIVFIGLAVIGILVQTASLRGSRATIT